ncbi:MAG TPA: hypothetical protein ACFE0H_14860 [Elainellaceae cyanobacterium]
MLNPTIKFCPPRLSIINRFNKSSLTGLLLTLGLIVGGLSALPAQGIESSSAMQSPVNREPSQAANSESSASMLNGVYLYGQSPQPDEIGAAYMVFEVNGDRVVGAFYMPYSSFDCFYGELQANQLALNITDSYERDTYPYSVAITTPSAVATADSPAIAPAELEGYHQIDAVSDNDHRILDTCRANYQQSL